MKKKQMPKTIVVYVCDYDNEVPVFAVADGGIINIPEDAKGEPIGIYKLCSQGKLHVVKELR